MDDIILRNIIDIFITNYKYEQNLENLFGI